MIMLWWWISPMTAFVAYNLHSRFNDGYRLMPEGAKWVLFMLLANLAIWLVVTMIVIASCC